jgi:hypothetical protein
MANVAFSAQLAITVFFLLIRFILRKCNAFRFMGSIVFEDVFAVLNIFGLFTTDLVHMSRYHVFELTILGLHFINDLLAVDKDWDTWGEWVHHILSLVGISLQLHFGLGGGLMAFLVLDELTGYVTNDYFYWPVFLFLRVISYNTVIFLAVQQDLAAPPSLALTVWIWAILIWGIFAFIYHAAWLWRERFLIAATYRSLCGRSSNKVVN